jgi:DNA repair exonuclease SbcCD ATPase subunit
MPSIVYEDLYLKNAYIYQECRVPLDAQGLVFLRGLNLDDRSFLGAGKSTIPNAFARLQTGKNGKTELVNDLINFQAGKDMEQCLRLRKNDHPYEIQQYRKHSTYGTCMKVIDRESGENLLPRDIKHPHVWIRKEFLKIDEATFFNLVYLTQDMSHVLLHGKEGERREKLTVMFNLDVYDRFHDQIKSRIRIANTEIRSLQSVEATLDSIRDDLSKQEHPKELRLKSKKYQKKIDVAQLGFSVTMNKLDELKDLLSKLEQRYNTEISLNQLWEQSHAVRKHFGSIESISPKQVTALSNRMEEKLQEKTTLLDQAEKARLRSIIEGQLEKLDEEIGEDVDLESWEEKLSNLKSKLHHLNNVELPAAEKREKILQDLAKLPSLEESAHTLSSLRNSVEEANEKANEVEGRLRRNRKKLNSGVCSECKRPLHMSSEEVEDLKDSLKTDRVTLKAERKKYYRAKKQLEAMEAHTALEEELEILPVSRSAQVILREVRSLIKDEKRIVNVLELTQQRSKLEGQLEGIPDEGPEDLEEQARVARKAYRNLKQVNQVALKLLQLRRDLKKLPRGDRVETSKQVSKLTRDVRGLGNRIKKLSLKQGAVDESLRQVRELRKKAKKLKTELKTGLTAKRELVCLEALGKAFGPTGLKQDRFRAILNDAMERTIPAYTSRLWPYKKVFLKLDDETNGLQFRLARHGKSHAVKSSLLSGGENHKAGLAFLLGMRDLKEMYTDCSFNVLIIDEPFGNLDPQGTESLLAILESLKSRFSSIFVISHRPEVMYSAIWDQVWWAIRKNDVSRLYTDDPPLKYQKMAQRFATSGEAL